MNNVLIVHVFQTLSHLLNNHGSLFLRQLLFLFDVLKTTIGKSLQNKIQILLVVEVTVKRCKVRMIQIGLDLDFSQNVLGYFRFSYPFFGHLFYHANESNVLLLSNVNISKGSFP